MADLVLLHNTACSTSRHALEAVATLGAEVEVVHYLKHPLDRAALLALLARLEDPPQDLVRKDNFFRERGLRAEDYVSAEAVADLLVEFPRLMQRPILMAGERAIIGRPPERVASFLAAAPGRTASP